MELRVCLKRSSNSIKKNGKKPSGSSGTAISRETGGFVSGLLESGLLKAGLLGSALLESALFKRELKGFFSASLVKKSLSIFVKRPCVTCFPLRFGRNREAQPAAVWINCCNPASNHAILVPSREGFYNYLELQDSCKIDPSTTYPGDKIFVTRISNFSWFLYWQGQVGFGRLARKGSRKNSVDRYSSVNVTGLLWQGLRNRTGWGLYRCCCRSMDRVWLPVALKQSTDNHNRTQPGALFADASDSSPYFQDVCSPRLLDQGEVLIAVPGDGNLLLIHLTGHHFCQVDDIIGR